MTDETNAAAKPATQSGTRHTETPEPANTTTPPQADNGEAAMDRRRERHLRALEAEWDAYL